MEFIDMFTLAVSLSFILPVVIFLAAALFNNVTRADQNFAQSPLLTDKPPVLKEAVELTLMTYNIADAYGFTANRRERVTAIAHLLVELDVDIAAIQEAYVKIDRSLLYDIVAASPLKYRAEYPAALIGNGIVILSKFPIVETYFHRFRANNAWYKLWEGDWWVGKGVALSRVRLENGGILDVYNIHTQAYRGNQASIDARFQQFREAIEFINRSKTGSAPALFLGDFNTEQTQADYRYAEETLGLQRIMNIDSKIDHLTAIKNGNYQFEVVDTEAIDRVTMGAHAGKFYSRAPNPSEFWGLHFGAAEETHLSDHKAYVSTIRIIPKC